jgi:fluoroacetyl-CoA thioesterase
MKSAPKIGTVGSTVLVVEPRHGIEFATDGIPAVLSTPNLIALLERTARESLLPFLEAGEGSVGAEIELRHFAPTPVGARVTLTTRVIHAAGKMISFQVEARDEHELIARGVHTRAVIRRESFARKVERKTGRV